MCFARHGRETGFPWREAAGFTLLEMMMAIAVLALVFTAVTVSLRGKWKAEEARRGAQCLALAWVKARSHAWREGREWVVEWDVRNGMVRGRPTRGLGGFVEQGTEEDHLSPGFSYDLGRGLQVFSEDVNEEVPPVHFYANQRVTPASVVVTAPGQPRWRVRIDWDGKPVLEPAGMAPVPAGGGPSPRPLPRNQSAGAGAEAETAKEP